MNLELELGGTILSPNENGTSTYTTVTLFISSFGVALSVLALVLLLTTACLFQEWRSNYKNQLLIQFMLARCLYTFVRYLFDVRRIFDFCGGNGCVFYMDEAMMIYSEITLVLWMFIFTRQMYNSLVKVFSPKRPNIWKVSMATWVAPILVTVIMYGIEGQNNNQLMVFFVYLAIMKWPLLIANAVILIMILKSLIKDNKTKVNSSANNKRMVIVMNFLIFFFCFQQAAVDIYKLIYMVGNLPTIFLVLINIGTMYHCAMALTFWVFGNAKTRRMWRNKLSCKAKVPLSPQTSLNTNK